ncbi:hypothetical protein [Flavobacterium sp.]|jgi:hypothetical protein|uniref:hypothetical protein n=1 Tax=Flavobacterium sp. TaxID=239 RepID=UPI0037C048A4
MRQSDKRDSLKTEITQQTLLNLFVKAKQEIFSYAEIEYFKDNTKVLFKSFLCSHYLPCLDANGKTKYFDFYVELDAFLNRLYLQERNSNVEESIAVLAELPLFKLPYIEIKKIYRRLHHEFMIGDFANATPVRYDVWNATELLKKILKTCCAYKAEQSFEFASIAE